jgi:hypothetical protein
MTFFNLICDDEPDHAAQAFCREELTNCHFRRWLEIGARLRGQQSRALIVKIAIDLADRPDLRNAEILRASTAHRETCCQSGNKSSHDCGFGLAESGFAGNASRPARVPGWQRRTGPGGRQPSQIVCNNPSKRVAQWRPGSSSNQLSSLGGH